MPPRWERWNGCSTPSPVENVYLRSELRLLGSAAPWWCLFDGGRVRAAMLAGALTVPYLPDLADAPQLAEAARAHTPPHLMVGPRAAVLALHGCLEPRRVAREIHDPQPVMVVDRQRLRVLPPAPLRRSTRRDVDALAGAAAVMHREEMTADSTPPDASAWRARMSQLVDRGWSWAWMQRPGRVQGRAERVDTRRGPGPGRLHGPVPARSWRGHRGDGRPVLDASRAGAAW